MRAIEAETFSGYGGLRQVELPKPQAGKDRVLVHVTAAGVTPLDHTILAAAPRPQRLADVSPIRPASRHATGALCGNDRLLEIGGVPGGHCARHGVAILRYAEHAERTRRYDDQSKDVGLSLPRQFCRDCIIATRGYDFREGQPLSPSQSCPGCTTTTSGHNFRKGQVALESNDGK